MTEIKHIIISILLIVTLIETGCTTLNKVANTFKSNEQIALDEKESKYETAKKEFKTKEINLASLVKKMDLPPSVESGAISNAVVQARRDYLEIKRLYVEALKAGIELKIAELNKQARKAGYFALGNKAVGVGSGIASAALVAASPANAVWVAGLTTFSTGLIAFEGRAEEVGFSTTIANIKNDAIKERAEKAYMGFSEINFAYLYSFAYSATQPEWLSKIKDLGKAIIQYEIALRYARSNVVINIEGQKSN